jgi:hypothetical protein
VLGSGARLDFWRGQIRPDPSSDRIAPDDREGRAAMPLASTTHEAMGDVEDISITMMDGEFAVRVEVQRKLLVALASLGRSSPAQQLATLQAHREQVERVASAKYDHGDFHRYANGAVVRVTPADWDQHRRALQAAR